MIHSVNGYKMHLFAGARVLALFCGGAAFVNAHAQEAPSEPDVAEATTVASPAPAVSSEVEEIVVTASRVQRQGFEAPTPTTVLSSETLEKLGSTDIASALNQMPAFQADQNASRNPLGSSAGRRYVNLRNLGSQRTLVLMDGQRLPPSALTGQVDLNAVPQILIDRVDVVTGGASAQWGSDAVAGVVNMVTKKNLKGFLGDVSYGESSRGDNTERHIGLAYGTDFGGSDFHLVAGGEYVDNNGVGDMYTRDWGREEWGYVSVAGQLRVLPNVRRSNLATGGLINSGPLAGTTFDRNGQPRDFTYGSLVGAGTMQGGDGYADGDGQGTPLKVPVERGAGQVRLGWNVTPNTELFAQASYAGLEVQSYGPGPLDNVGAITIRSGNAYLPSSIQQYMTNQNLASFTMGRYWKDDVYNDADRLVRPLIRNENTTGTYTLGGAGKLGETWNWDAYSQYSRSVQNFYGDGYRLQARFFEAADAVFDPSGVIVCRSTLTNPGNGCVPVNLFGEGSVTPEAYNYFTADQHTKTIYSRSAFAANLRGEPISNWAGPISIATGVEYRSDDAELKQNDPFALARAYNFGNTQPISGDIEVTEGYIEAVVPLLADVPLVKSLDFNGAVRQAHYSTSGNITTWKAGLIYSLDDNLRLRTSWSRDIRAPNISELYTATSTGVSNIIDPRDSGNLTVTTISSGNQDLDPETANTKTAGVVLTPSFLPNFKLSIDYYDIKIEDVISSVGAQTIVNFCQSGAASYCSLVTYTSEETATVQLPFLNLAALQVKGWDLESAYHLNLGSVAESLAGSVDVNVFLTYQPTVIVDNGVTAVDRAGDMGTAATPYGGPKWKWNTLLTYSLDNFSTTLGFRYVGAGKRDVTYTEANIDDNSIESVVYTSLAVGYKLPQFSNGMELQLYGNVQNLTDVDPPVVPINSSGNPFNATFHDVVGRTYMAGLRARF
jgi:iron complex outermembrane receptor protein